MSDKRRATKRRPRGSLDLADITEAAMAIIDEHGVEALTIRRLSSELNVGAMTLYGYVNSKDDIVNLVASKHFEEIVVARPVDGNWIDAAKITYRSLRRLYLNHPYIATVHTSQATPPPSAYALIEQILELFEEAGMDRPTAASVHLALLNYTLGAALFGLPREPSAGISQELVTTLHALSADDFPSLSATALVLARAASDEQFEFGLDSMLRGICELLPTIDICSPGSMPAAGGAGESSQLTR